MFATTQELRDKLHHVLTHDSGKITITNPELLRSTFIDQLIFTAVFSSDTDLKLECKRLISNIAEALTIVPSSIKRVYQAIGEGKISGFTVPAMNIRALTYDTGRIVFRLAKQHNIGAFIFEIARSEMDYTLQRPDEFAASILAAAIKEDYVGHVFLQGDHLQFSKRVFIESPEKEQQRIKDLIRECIEAKFYNIDIDGSTLVDLSKTELSEQQKLNYEQTAALTTYIRSLEPHETAISIGGEIGHIGGKNSTVFDFEAFMKGYLDLVHENGISKVSVQTGTSHGGIPLADGSMADVSLDFSVLRDIGEAAREKYRLGGAVQHGASTLPHSLFGTFVTSKTLEIHLSTGFQNIVFDTIPASLREEMEQWIRDTLQDEREAEMSESQFLYKLRKKAIGPFKEKLWNLSEEEKEPIRAALEKEFIFLFQTLKVVKTKDILAPYV